MPADVAGSAARPAAIAAAIAFPRRIPFVHTLGVELMALGDGRAELRLGLSEPLTNSHGMAHGGLLMTLLDVAMAHAARSVFPGTDDPGVVTIEMKTSFLRSSRGLLTARGTLLHKTVTMAFTEGHVLDEQGHLCAHATGTFKYVRAPKGARPTGDLT
jgi:uncharacterized protein (TIGR00369 family)